MSRPTGGTRVRLNETGSRSRRARLRRSFVANNYRSHALRAKSTDGRRPPRRELLMKFVDVYRATSRVGRPSHRAAPRQPRRRRRPASNLWTDGRPSDRAIRRTPAGAASVRAMDTVGLDQPPYTPVALRLSGEPPNYQRRPRPAQ